MRILIIETESIGHYLVGYIKYILRCLNKKKFQVTILTTKKTSQHPSFLILKNENKNINLEFIKKIKLKNKQTISLIFYQIKLYFSIKKKFRYLNKKSKFDHVILNSFERFDKALCVFGTPFQNVNFSGIYLGIRFHLKEYKIFFKGRFDFISKFLFQRLIKFQNLKAILTNDFFLVRYLKKKRFVNYNKVHFLHEPKEFNYSYNKLVARKNLNLSKKSKLLLVYGALIQSKGIKELVSAILDSNINKNLSVVLAGQQSEEINNFFNTKVLQNLIFNKKLYIFSGWQSEINEAKIFSACDIVWIGYNNYPIPSGVLYQAATKRLPIIVSNKGIINHFNKKFKLGYTVNINNTSDIVNKINAMCDYSNYISFFSNIEKFRRKANPNIWINKFKKVVIN
jgi:glycosyltransferase involved in cell wall biosynthesis